MSKKINMNGSDDIFYRYKMPEVIIKQQGAFSVMTNIDELVKPKYINRPIENIRKFLNKYFHTSWTYKNNYLITSGSIKKEKLQEAILEYIKKFVLCSVCSSPETINSNDGKNVFNKCNSCGNIDSINDSGIIVDKTKIKNLGLGMRDARETVDECVKNYKFDFSL